MNLIKLPSPQFESKVTVEQALYKRRTVRDFKQLSIGLPEVSMLLWAAQGTTALGGYRTTPSAGALFPLELYLVAGNVNGLDAGVYHYRPHDHLLARMDEHDRRSELSAAALEQTWMQNSAVILVFTAVKERTLSRYGHGAVSFIFMEAGHAAQNVYLEAQALGLGTAAVGSFDKKKIEHILKLKDEELALYLMPVGRI